MFCTRLKMVRITTWNERSIHEAAINQKLTKKFALTCNKGDMDLKNL